MMFWAFKEVVTVGGLIQTETKFFYPVQKIARLDWKIARNRHYCLTRLKTSGSLHYSRKTTVFNNNNNNNNNKEMLLELPI